MNTDNKTKVFLVLVPHRDARVELKKYSEKIYADIPAGTYNFPWVAPLTLLSKPLDSVTLKETAVFLRKTIAETNGIKAKFTANEAGTITFPTGTEDMMLYGLNLGVGNREWGVEIISNRSIPYSPYPTPVIGTFLLRNEDDAKILPPPPQVSFRAAAVANMFWQPYKDGYKWKIGSLAWLPRYLTAPGALASLAGLALP